MKVARLRILLAGVSPAVIRTIEVPVEVKLSRLHLVIQAAMPWTNSHLFAFHTPSARWGMPFEVAGLSDMPKVRNANSETLADLIATLKRKRFGYVYDFGDDWLHEIVVEKVLEPQAGEVYPRLVEAEGRCPPDDVGGPWGYAELVEALADPEHDRHDEIIEWLGEDYDPAAFDKQARIKAVAKLAKRTKAKTPRGKSTKP